ncbi:unnamed protein product [Ectocarpus sp. 4 AP-2014]
MHMKPVERLLMGDAWLYQHMQHSVDVQLERASTKCESPTSARGSSWLFFSGKSDIDDAIRNPRF